MQEGSGAARGDFAALSGHRPRLATAVVIPVVACLAAAVANPLAAPASSAAVGVSSGVPLATPAIGLSGFVRDTAGQILAGTIVLAMPLGGQPPLTTTTLADGRYLFAQLAPGPYSVTAIKTGYRAGTAQVNTVMKRTLDIVLAPGEVDPELAASSSWMLRVPARDVLRDTGMTLEGVGGDGLDPGPVAPAPPDPDVVQGDGLGPLGAHAHPPLNGEVQQWFSGQAPAGPQSTDGTGVGTWLRLAMQVSDRMDVSVAGERARRDLQFDDGIETAERASGADEVGVKVGYGVGDLSRLDMQAGYRRNSLAQDGFDPELATPSDSESVLRSCSTSWRRTVGEAGRLDVSALYVDEVSKLPSDVSSSAAAATSRLWGAGGEYRTPLGSDHMISVALQARMYEVDEAADAGSVLAPGGLPVLTEGSPLALAGPAPPGWAIHLHGGEQWALNPALGLDFGFDYLRSLSVRETSHLMPQAGATWKPGAATAVKAGLSWLADVASGSTESNPALPTQASRGSDRLGYSLQLEQRAGARTVVAASAYAAPLSFGTGAAEPIPVGVGQRPLYISDGQARSRQAGVELRQRIGSLTATAGVDWGHVDGLYAVAFPGEPLRDMHEGQLDYQVAALTASTRNGATETRVEYRTLTEQDEGSPGAAPIDDAILSLQVSQALDFVQLGDTHWRVMFAWQNGLGSDHPAENDHAGHRAYRMEDRVSGGLSVRF